MELEHCVLLSRWDSQGDDVLLNTGVREHPGAAITPFTRASGQDLPFFYYDWIKIHSIS